MGKKFAIFLILCFLVFVISSLGFVNYFFSSEGKKISASLSILNEDESKVSIDSICKGSPKLIFRIPKIYCGPCMVTEIGYLDQLSKKIDLNSLVVLTSFSNIRDFISFKRAYCKNISCYNIESLEVRIDNNNKGELYYFMLSPDMKISNIYFSDRQSPKSSRAYLHKIAKEIFGIPKDFLE
jgi:hypothetical protein